MTVLHGALHFVWEAAGVIGLLALAGMTLGGAVIVTLIFGPALRRTIRAARDPFPLLRLATWRKRRRMARTPAARQGGYPAQPLSAEDQAAWQKIVEEATR